MKYGDQSETFNFCEPKKNSVLLTCQQQVSFRFIVFVIKA